ncbi:uncharacterized protein BXZ73DRAFT_100177 [Epithele typhae]|uniref:uncharacterized protein n=1 Tax=Epithele typhae TaxID=378194 RepID=UPI0020074784|nr:uncharacterized protein BXZ73DRAFT_100177 [Epithele typhae]KAH9936755.1 hypothetical protein BXZ73DRAFT_100177 [Epithele typhae]
MFYNPVPSRLRSSVPTTTKEQADPFALLDIHDATVGRDLCLVMPLAQPNAASDLMERIGIQATLVCTYSGVSIGFMAPVLAQRSQWMAHGALAPAAACSRSP